MELAKKNTNKEDGNMYALILHQRLNNKNIFLSQRKPPLCPNLNAQPKHVHQKPQMQSGKLHHKFHRP